MYIRKKSRNLCFRKKPLSSVRCHLSCSYAAHQIPHMQARTLLRTLLVLLNSEICRDTNDLLFHGKSLEEEIQADSSFFRDHEAYNEEGPATQFLSQLCLKLLAVAIVEREEREGREERDRRQTRCRCEKNWKSAQIRPQLTKAWAGFISLPHTNSVISHISSHGDS